MYIYNHQINENLFSVVYFINFRRIVSVLENGI